MKQIVRLINNAQAIDITDSIYKYNGVSVPRVTHIINKCISNESLVNWANSMGFKHINCNDIRDKAAMIGSICHENIDMFSNDNNHQINDDAPKQSIYAYNSFLNWFNQISTNNIVKILMHEKPLVCKWFGGTIDALYEINGKKWIVDYKTSNSVRMNYLLQVAAYRYMLEQMGINIDGGAIILKLSKTNIGWEEYVLNFSNKHDLDVINYAEQTFLSMVYTYYNIMNLEYLYNSLKW